MRTPRLGAVDLAGKIAMSTDTSSRKTKREVFFAKATLEKAHCQLPEHTYLSSDSDLYQAQRNIGLL